MDDPKTKLITRIQECTNVLVTVSNNPSLDQLAGAIGLTLLLNQLGKHATAVFSGEVPSIIEYLKPEETIEKNTDSLRDFIIALDKSKADKLRYKVEDKMVKIFITPYRTSLSEKDLEFSQGDFNVDLVIAIGVHEQKDLDQAIVAHGRILHDATVSSINNQDNGNLGTIAWIDTTASSLCEMLYGLCIQLKADALDPQMATAFLTGIVAETKRFGNEKTTAKTMDISSHLMSAGANQQLVAAKLDTPPMDEPEEPNEPPKPTLPPPTTSESEVKVQTEAAGPNTRTDTVFKPAPKIKEQKDEGIIQVEHTEETPEEEKLEEIKIDEKGTLYRPTEEVIEEPSSPLANLKASSGLVTEPPVLASPMSAISGVQPADPALEPTASTSQDGPLLSHATNEADVTDAALPAPTPDSQTLTDIEKAVGSPHQNSNPNQPVTGSGSNAAGASTAELNAARDAVMDAVNSGVDLMPPEPRVDLNAAPALENINQSATSSLPALEPIPAVDPLKSASQAGFTAPTPAYPIDNPTSFPSNLMAGDPGLPPDQTAAPTADPLAPPPVPPPMMPQGFVPPTDASSDGDHQTPQA